MNQTVDLPRWKGLVAGVSMIICLAALEGTAQSWEDDVRLTFQSAPSVTSTNNAWCVAASKDSIHVVWADDRHGRGEAYYKLSADNGRTWGEDKRLTEDDAGSESVCVGAWASNVHVIWLDRREGPTQVFYKNSADNGSTWSADARLTDTLQPCRHPSTAVWGDNVHVVWEDGRYGMSAEIHYLGSDDNGETWADDARLTRAGGYSGSPSIAVWEENLHMVWQDNRDGSYGIFYKHSADNGQNWGEDTRLAAGTYASYYPCIAASGENLHVVWTDERDYPYEEGSEIYYKHSADNGLSWSSATRLTQNPGFSRYPSVAASGGSIHVVWVDERVGNPEIYCKISADNGQTWSEDTRLTESRFDSRNPSIAVCEDDIHVVWTDDRDGNQEVYYKHGTFQGGISDAPPSLPDGYTVDVSPGPNPTIRYFIPEQGRVSVQIFDASGRRIKSFPSKVENPGYHEITWDSLDEHGNPVNSSICFCRLKTEKGSVFTKFVLLGY